MELESEINKIEKITKKNEKKLEEHSLAMEIVKLTKEQTTELSKANKRLTYIIYFLIFSLIVISGMFIYYIKTGNKDTLDKKTLETILDKYAYEETYEYATSDGDGNACVGDYCNNGEINYGDSSKEN